MWEFRRRPKDLESTAAQALETLFAALPELRGVYDLRWELTRIFEEAPDRATAASAIEDWRRRAEQSGLDWRPFLAMYDRHREGILGLPSLGVISAESPPNAVSGMAYALDRQAQLFPSPVHV